MNKNNLFIKFAYCYKCNLRHILENLHNIKDYTIDLLEPFLKMIIVLLIIIINIFYIFIPIGQMISAAFLIRWISKEDLKNMGVENEMFLKEGYIEKHTIKKLKEKIEKELMENHQ